MRDCKNFISVVVYVQREVIQIEQARALLEWPSRHETHNPLPLKHISPYMRKPDKGLQTATTLSTLAPGGVVGDRGDVLDTSDLHAGTSKTTEGRLGARSGGLGLVASSSTELDVEGSDAELLAASSDVLGGKHRRVGRGLVTVSLDLHSSGNADQGLAAGKVSHVDEGVVEARVDVSDSEDVLALLDVLGAELGSLTGAGGLSGALGGGGLSGLSLLLDGHSNRW